MDERAKACDLVINWCSPYPEIKSASGVCSFDTSQKNLFLFQCHFLVFRSLCPLSASSKTCCAPKWRARTYVALGRWCRTAGPAAIAATTVASPWKLTVGWRPSASTRFPLTSKIDSPYTAVTSTLIINLIQVNSGKQSISIAQQ